MSARVSGDAVRLRALHWVARVMLRVRSPLHARALVERIGRRLPPLRGVEGARDAVLTLFPSGSCLSRAVAIAAVLPDADVVIGVDPWQSARLRAHAWLEIGGERVDTDPRGSPLPEELARLPRTALTDDRRPPRSP